VLESFVLRPSFRLVTTLLNCPPSMIYIIVRILSIASVSGTTLMEQAILAFLSGAKDPDLFRAADKNAIGRRSIDSSSSTFAKVLHNTTH